MIGFLIWHLMFNSDSGTSRGGRYIPLPPRHLMTTRPELPKKIKKKNKKKKNGK
jgi:hypothetical protein